MAPGQEALCPGRRPAGPLLGPIGATETLLDVTRLRCSAGDLATFDLDPLFARGMVIEYR